MQVFTLPEQQPVGVAALSPIHEQVALHALTLAFERDPPCRWLFPDGRGYHRHCPSFARAFGGAAIDRGTALQTPAVPGVARWPAPGEEPDGDAVAAIIKDSVGPQRKENVFGLFAEMTRLHPTKAHWYLPLMGVAPASQGQGLGSTLLHRFWWDATRRVCRPNSRHGFGVMPEIRVGDCPPLIPMLRRLEKA